MALTLGASWAELLHESMQQAYAKQLAQVKAQPLGFHVVDFGDMLVPKDFLDAHYKQSWYEETSWYGVEGYGVAYTDKIYPGNVVHYEKQYFTKSEPEPEPKMIELAKPGDVMKTLNDMYMKKIQMAQAYKHYFKK